MNPSAIDFGGRAEPPTSERAAIAATAGFIGIAAFELALALGAPLGRAAMGGGHTQLPTELRIASAVLALFWPAAALVVLRRAGYRVPLISFAAAHAGTWALVALLILGVAMNLASSSPWERFLMAPISASFVALCFVVVRSRPA